MISLISYYADLAIGLVLAFLLLSLLVSGLNEGIARLLGIRSKFLWAYLRDTLDGAEAVERIPAAMRALDRLLHALKGLGRRLRAPLMELLPASSGGRSRLPATLLGVFARLPFGRDPRPPFTPRPAPARSGPLVPAADSVHALGPVDPGHLADQADAVEATGNAGVPGTSAQPVPPARGMSLAELLHERLQEIDHGKSGRTSISAIPPVRFALAMMEIAAAHGGMEKLVADLEALGSPVSLPLKAVWARTNHDLEAFRHGVEEWFDGEMERLTLLYRRYVRWVLAALGVAVTLLFGMDALEYGKTLLRDSAYRSEVAAFAQSGPQALAPVREQCGPGRDTYACVTDVLSTPALVKIFMHAPVGVTMHTDGGPSWQWRPGDWWDRLSSPGHWPGYALTAVALLFGAPFWWDMLRRISGIRVRSSGSGTG